MSSYHLLFFIGIATAIAMASATTANKEPEAAKGCPFAFHPSTFDAKNSVVHRHAALFSTVDNASLTTESMTHGHSIQGITEGVSIKAKAITNLLVDKKLPVTAAAVATVENPAATGIWDKKGRFDATVFEEVAALAISIPNVKEKVLTEAIIMEYLQKKHAGKDLGTATWIRVLVVVPVPVSWEAVTAGSIKELIKYFGNAKTAEGETAITVSRMRQFYEDPNSLVLKRIAEQAAAK